MKKILLGVTGSISAYKSADLTSQFVKLGAQVDVIMSKKQHTFYHAINLAISVEARSPYRRHARIKSAGNQSYRTSKTS